MKLFSIITKVSYTTWLRLRELSDGGSLAQSVEHLTFNQGVPGSNPG